MTDKPANYELDDELLSAYLDGELSAEERAAVEARLAADPAAQQLLHELRSVSQSVQAMPTESVGRDLSGEIMRRARAAKPVMDRSAPTKLTAAAAPSNLSDTIPKITVFGSKRAWIWASLAIAAGLLIMVVQSGDESKNKLPPVAERERDIAQIRSSDEAGNPARRKLELSPAPASPSSKSVTSNGRAQEKISPPVAPGASMPSDALRSTAGGGAVSSPAAATASPDLKKASGSLSAQDHSKASTSQLSDSAVDKSGASPQPSGPTGHASGVGGAMGLADQQQKSESARSDQRFVVVHVVAKPEALQAKSFERLLADNKIRFEPQPTSNQPLTLGGGQLPKQAETEPASPRNYNTPAKPGQGQAVEMILVEAPETAIVACLDGLKNNAADYPGLAVNEESQSRDRSDGKSIPAKNLEKNLSRYNRGTISQSQNNSTGEKNNDYDFDLPSPQAANGSPRGGSFDSVAGSAHETNGNKITGSTRQPTAEVGRARRVLTLGAANRRAGESVAGTRAGNFKADAETMKRPAAQPTLDDRGEVKANRKNNNWKVLFVFSPEDAAAPSAPPVSQPK